VGNNWGVVCTGAVNRAAGRELSRRYSQGFEENVAVCRRVATVWILLSEKETQAALLWRP